MRVLEDQDRRLGEQRTEELDHDLLGSLLPEQLVELGGSLGIGEGEPERDREQREPRLQIGRDDRYELLEARRRFRRGGFDTDDLFEQLPDREVRRCGPVQPALCAPDRNSRVALDLTEESALAGPGISDDLDDPATPVGQAVDERREPGQILVTPDEGQLEPRDLGAHTARRTDRMRGHW